MEFTRVILHVDMDAFFASIEQRDNPAYRDKPVVVGARPGHRGVVAAASYEARRFGIHSAMPINEAYRRCPQGVFVRPRGDIYGQESHLLMGILRSFSPRVEQISVDEAFVDISGTQRLWGTPRETAEKLSVAIRTQRNLTASVGIAPNKYLAKIASDLNKPRGITEAPFDENAIVEWLAPMPVGRIWGVGKKTEAMLSRLGVRTIGDLQRFSRDYLIERFGAGGDSLWELSRGIDLRTVGNEESARSISREHTFDRDCSDVNELKRIMLSLSRDVGHQARQEGLKGRTIFLTYRLPDFSRHTRRLTLPDSTWLAKRIFECAVKLLDKEGLPVGGFRLIGVGITNFGEEGQTDLFTDHARESAWEKSETAMDRLNAKFGEKSVFLGGEITWRGGADNQINRCATGTPRPSGQNSAVTGQTSL